MQFIVLLVSILLLGLMAPWSAQAFSLAHPHSVHQRQLQHHHTRSQSRLPLHMSSPQLDDTTRTFLDNVVKSNKVVLFMKGNALFPQCGFSNTACRILDALGTKFEAVNVLESDKIRNGIKVYSSWPTIPQLYVGGEFVGGSDIMIELYNNGQLAEMVELANAN